MVKLRKMDDNGLAAWSLIDKISKWARKLGDVPLSESSANHSQMVTTMQEIGGELVTLSVGKVAKRF